MIEQIGELIVNKINSCGLSWTDKVFGVVDPLTYPEGSNTKTEAFICNSDIQQCDSAIIKTAEPRSNYNSLIFIQPFKPQFETDWSCKTNEYSGKLQMYVWVNMRNLEVDDATSCDVEFVFKEQLIQCLNGFIHNSATYPNYFELCLDSISPGSEISDKYTFSKSKNTLIDQTNYEFVLNFDITIKVVNSCLNAVVSIKDPNCLPTPFMQLFGLAKLGHSVTKLLNKLWLGSIMNVVNDLGQALDIPFLNDELDQASLLAHAGSGDAFVDIIYDQSNNGFHLTAPSASARPKIVDAGVIITANGKPACEFDGIDDTLFVSTLGLTNPTSEYYVFQAISLDPRFGLTNGGTTGGAFAITVGGGISLQQGGGFATGAVIVNGNQYIEVAKTDTDSGGINFIHRQNGIDNSDGTAIGTNVGQQLTLGQRGNMTVFRTMKFQECVLYDSDESSKFIDWETQINEYYGAF